MKEERLAQRIYGYLQKILSEESLEKVISLLAEKASRGKGKVLVILPTSPSTVLKSQVEARVEKLFGARAVIEYQVKPQIVGGFILEGRGQRYDYSLEKSIDSLFEDGRTG